MKDELVDVETLKTTDCPDIALAVMKKVSAHKGSMDILLSPTGQEMCMSANCYKGVRTALCFNVYGAKMSRENYDANILAIGSNVVDHGIARNIVKAFLATNFSNDEGDLRRIEKMEKRKRKLRMK